MNKMLCRVGIHTYTMVCVDADHLCDRCECGHLKPFEDAPALIYRTKNSGQRFARWHIDHHNDHRYYNRVVNGR